jgi:hypothetical protein
MKILFAIICAFALWSAYNGFLTRERSHPPGSIATEEPRQRNIDNGASFQRDRYTLTPRAKFSATARPLRTERYRTDVGAEIAPIDVAIGWGPMSDSALLDQLKFSQSGRFLHWSANKPPTVAWDVINRSAANMHVIPADPSVLQRLSKARIGDLIEIDGELVDVKRNDGWRWNTSMTRDDQGGGACELIYVTNVVIRSP